MCQTWRPDPALSGKSNFHSGFQNRYQYMILERLSHPVISLLVWLSLLAATVFLRSSGLESVQATRSVDPLRFKSGQTPL